MDLWNIFRKRSIEIDQVASIKISPEILTAFLLKLSVRAAGDQPDQEEEEVLDDPHGWRRSH